MCIHRIYTVTTPCLNAQLSQVGKTYWKGYVRSLTHGNSEDILQRVDEVIDTRQQGGHERVSSLHEIIDILECVAICTCMQ